MKSIFINNQKQLRSGWKIALAFLGFFILLYICGRIVSELYINFYWIFNSNISDTSEIADQFMKDQASTESVLGFLLSCIQDLIIIFICIVLWKLLDKKSMSQLGLTSLKYNKVNLVEGLISGAVSLTLAAVILLLTNSAELEGSISNPKFSFGIIVQFFLFILVGFSEEIFCRGYCLNVLKQCKGKWVPYAGSAIIFSLMHSLNSGINILGYINIFLVGIFLSYAVYKSGSLWLGIGYHITWNFFEGNVFGFLVSGGEARTSIYTLKTLQYNLMNGGSFGPEGGLAVTVVLILLILWVYKFVGVKKIYN